MTIPSCVESWTTMLTETYADILINMLWFFTPGANTPMQYFLTNQLHASNAVCADFSALYYAGFLPPCFSMAFSAPDFPRAGCYGFP